MLKTNSKKYLSNMEKYLLGQIDGTDYGTPTDTPTQKINFVFDCFKSEFECDYEKRRTPNQQERFSEWLSGLPSCISLPCYYNEIIELAKEEKDQEFLFEAETKLIKLESMLRKKELELMLSGEADHNDTFIDINAGAGGTESQDWAQMLLRMYTRWCLSLIHI